MMFYAADYRRLARENLRGSWGLSMAVVFMATLLGGVVGGASMSIEIPNVLQRFVADYMPALYPLVQQYSTAMIGLGLAQLILGGTIALGNVQYHLDQYDRKPLAFRTLFSRFHQFGAGLCLRLLVTLYCILWGLVPVIPGTIIGLLLDLFTPVYGFVLVILFTVFIAAASYSYALSFYLMTEYPEMSAGDAIRASKNIMRGRKWELFCLDFSFTGLRLLSGLTLGIGNLLLGPYVSAAYAAFYRQIKSPRETNELQYTPASPEERNLSL